MSKYQLLALLFGLLLVAAPLSRADEYGDDDDEAEAEKDDEEKDVVVLTDKTFDDTIKNSKYALVEFYAPWCGHCKSLKPHYAKAATELKKYDPSIVIGKVDATVETATAQKIGIQGYPTLKWYVDGQASEYNGGRDAEAIIKWVQKKTGPFAITAESPEALANLEKENPVIVFGYFTSFDGDAYEAFKSVGQKSEDVVFAQTTDSAVAAAAGTTVAPGIVIIKNFKGESRETVNLIGDVTAETLSTFVKGEKLPLTIEFSSENSDKIFNSGINKQMILWAKAADLEVGSAIFDAYRATSKKFKGQLVFVVVNNEGEGHEPVTNYFGLKEANPPVVLGFWMEKNKKFKFSGEITEAALSEFAEAVLDGTAPVEYKSAPIPEDDKDGDVQIVVGKTYESIVNDAKKDVLLEVYAPWCGHCKKLDPIYKKLAKRFKKVDSVVIAKMDGTENEHPDLEVKGFPTIVFVPAEEGASPITFQGGDRSLKALTKFIKQNAKVAYELPKKGEDGEDAKEAPAKDEL